MCVGSWEASDHTECGGIYGCLEVNYVIVASLPNSPCSASADIDDDDVDKEAMLGDMI